MSHPVAILGLGFTGTQLATLFAWPPGSCVTSRRRDATATLPVVHYEWSDDTTWINLPDDTRAMIITAPPVVRDDIHAERARLSAWCEWMRNHRPACDRVVYISTTGVYPQRPGTWDETCNDPAETDSGKLRLATEAVLNEHFDTRIVRAGGIYGPGRNLLTRLAAGKGPVRSERPIHRIHVHDLAHLCIAALADDAPKIVNAIDAEPATGADQLRWIAEQPWCEDPDHLRALADEQPPTPEGPMRVISNARLRDWLGDDFWRYPTFREGLSATV